MSTYAIGDIQGCFSEFRDILDLVHFDPACDRLWLVGDLVNRGSGSLETLRLVASLGKAAVTVLGNHDLHLLAVATGVERSRTGDTLDAILSAPDREELLDWLRTRPLFHTEDGRSLVHAGLLPQWNISTALLLSCEVQEQLSSPGYRTFLKGLYGNQPDCWSDQLIGMDRWRVIVNAMTRLRFASAEGVMDFEAKGEVQQAPPGYMPWFNVPGRRSAGDMIICGHWSALGLRLSDGLAALDTGCVWGGKLTALRLEDRKVFQVASRLPDSRHPG